MYFSPDNLKVLYLMQYTLCSENASFSIYLSPKNRKIYILLQNTFYYKTSSKESSFEKYQRIKNSLIHGCLKIDVTH